MSLIKVKVLDPTVSVREGLSKANKPYKINSQCIVAELNGEVRKVDINLPENTSGYLPGDYTIDPLTMITVGRYGFEFARFVDIKLEPVTKANALPFSKQA